MSAHDGPRDRQAQPVVAVRLRAVGATPVPVRLMVCGLLVAVSLMVTVPVSVPEVVGVKSTLIWQLAPAARLDPQLFVSAKLALATRLLIVRLTVHVLVSVADCEALLVPTA